MFLTDILHHCTCFFLLLLVAAPAGNFTASACCGWSVQEEIARLKAQLAARQANGTGDAVTGSADAAEVGIN